MKIESQTSRIKNAFALLRSGEDWLARQELASELNRLLAESADGEVGIGEFTERLERIASLGREFKKAMNSN